MISGCPNLVTAGYCAEHEKTRPVVRRVAYTVTNSRRWRRARDAFMFANPWCESCGKPSEELHHIVAHRGDYDLFWEPGNWQALCKRCHARITGAGG